MKLRHLASSLLAVALAACGPAMEQADTPSAVVAAPRPEAQAQQSADPTTGALRVFYAFNGRAPTAAEYNAFTSANSILLAGGFAAAMNAMSDSAAATAVLANLGVTAQTVNASSFNILQSALAQYFGAYGAGSRGLIVNNLVGLLAGLEADATWGAAARAFNSSINTARAVVAAATTAGGGCLPSVAQGFQGDIETVAANAGGGGGDGTGGGAAAGGGLGKVLGGTMSVIDLASGNTVGLGTTDAVTGLVTIKTCSLSGPFLLTLEGAPAARYFDEGRNALVDFPVGSVLHALVDRWDEHVGVSPLTEAAYRYALNNMMASPADVASGRTALRSVGSLVGLTAAQVRLANSAVATQVNALLTTNYAVDSAKALPTPLDASAGNTTLPASRYGRSAAMNGGLVRAASYYNPGVSAPALKFAADLAKDLTDGRIDGFAADGSPVDAGARVTYASTRLPVGGSLGTNAVATQFGTRLLPPEQRVEEEAAVLAMEGGGKWSDETTGHCGGWIDEAALMSDHSVTVLRHFPTTLSQGCAYLFTAAENAREQKLRRYVTDVKALAPGGQVGYAVKIDGTVVGWGSNWCGRLHPALPNGFYAQPTVIPGLVNVTSIRTELHGTIARDSAGGVYYWGVVADNRPENLVGRVRCGDPVVDGGRTYNWMQPTAMSRVELDNVVDVGIGDANFFALTSEGELYGWGEGNSGLLGNATTLGGNGNFLAVPVERPTRIAGVSKVRQFEVIPQTIFALQADGTLMAWGSDSGKLLGGGTQRMTARPTPVAGLAPIASFTASDHGLRLLARDGGVYAWVAPAFTDLYFPGQAFWTPTRVATPERVRYVASRTNNFSVLFESGRLGRDVSDRSDATAAFR